MSETARWISTFLQAAAAEAGAARNTQVAYGRDLRDFAQWCARAGHEFDTRPGPDRSLPDGLDAQGLARATRARRLASIRQMFRFAYAEGWRDTDPAARIAGPGKAAKLPQTLSPAEVRRFWTPPAARGAPRPSACATPA